MNKALSDGVTERTEDNLKVAELREYANHRMTFSRLCRTDELWMHIGHEDVVPQHHTRRERSPRKMGRTEEHPRSIFDNLGRVGLS